jgi:plastocyanin
MTSRLLRILLFVLAVALVGGACSSSGSGSTITIGSDKANDHGTKSVSGQSQVTITANSFFFNPTVLKGSAGQKIKIEIDNATKDTLHNFSLPEQSVDQDIQAGKNATVTVTFPQSGVLEFFCKYHRSSGMAGELSV